RLQADGKCRPFPSFARGIHGSAMRLDDCLHEAEAEAEPAFGPAAVAAKQTIPDPGQLSRWDSGTSVADAHNRVAILAAGAHLDAAAGRSVFDRVVDQIRRHLL